MPNYDRPVNVSALQKLVGMTPCAPTEMAPGVWVRLDCSFTPISRLIGYVNGAAGATAFPGLPSLPGLPALPSIPGLPGFQQPSSPTPQVTTTVVPGALPPAMDLRTMGLDGPVKNQGAVGACTAFSLSTAMDIGARKLGRQDTLAPLHVWSEYGIPNIGVAGDKSVDENIALETTWPYDPAKACRLEKDPSDSCGAAYGVVPGSGTVDPSLQNEKKNADSQGRYRVTGVEAFSTPVKTDEMAAVIAGGDPVWLSMGVNDDAWKSQSLTGDGVIPDYQLNSTEGHAIVLIGYRNTANGRQFLVHNSWGPRWGNNGYGWISDRMLTQFTRAAYKVRVADAGGLASPTNPNGPSAGCASGQSRDSVLGTCAATCPSGSAPAAGVCLPAVPGGLGIPGLPQQQPSQSCAQGQAVDPMTNQCAPVCPTGTPRIGGMCLPGLPGH
jgi:hypothetical protein